jgi:uncharacterized protein (TIGR02757 family)
MGLKEELDKLYLTYNYRKFVHPDPLEFLYNYENIEDREIAGLIASSLAYGRVAQILKSVSAVLDKMDPSPYLFIKESMPDSFINYFGKFKHRFTTAYELCCLLKGVKSALEKYGSLNNCFLGGFGKSEKTIVPAVLNFARNLNLFSGNKCSSLIPSFLGNSAFKRLNLYLRWMVRKDNVDPGGWYGIQASDLVIPLDTHMFRISSKLGFTARKQADIKTALEVTGAFKKINDYDPVKYDFSLTRLGMNKIEKIFLKKVI